MCTRRRREWHTAGGRSRPNKIKKRPWCYNVNLLGKKLQIFFELFLCLILRDSKEKKKGPVANWGWPIASLYTRARLIGPICFCWVSKNKKNRWRWSVNQPTTAPSSGWIEFGTQLIWLRYILYSSSQPTLHQKRSETGKWRPNPDNMVKSI